MSKLQIKKNIKIRRVFISNPVLPEIRSYGQLIYCCATSYIFDDTGRISYNLNGLTITRIPLPLR